MTDLHSHLLAGVDDGATTLAQSLAALETMRAQGVTRVVVTPHLRASSTRVAAELGRQLGRFDASGERLRTMAPRAGPDLARSPHGVLRGPPLQLSPADLTRSR